MLSAFTANAVKAEVSLSDYLKQQFSQSKSFVDKYDAEVWLLDKSHRLKPFVKNPKTRVMLLRKIHAASLHIELKPELVLALIETESSFNPYAISRSGAQGLMQIMPFWKKELGREDDNLTDIDTNLRYGCYILKYYIKLHKGNMSDALAPYNGSLGRTVYPNKVFKALKRWQ